MRLYYNILRIIIRQRFDDVIYVMGAQLNSTILYVLEDEA